MIVTRQPPAADPTAARIAELEAQVAWYRAELGQAVEATRLIHFRARWRLEPRPVRMMLALFDARPRVLSCAYLVDLLADDGARAHPGEDVIRVHACKIRQRLGADAIASAGHAYRITDAGAALCRWKAPPAVHPIHQQRDHAA